MIESVFVDTNVFVYARDPAYPAHARIAQGWIDRLAEKGAGRTSVQVLNELYATLIRKFQKWMTADDAWSDVCRLVEWKPQSLTPELATRAREVHLRYIISWWDSLIVAAAQAQDCRILLTEDMQSGMRFGDLVVLNPFAEKARNEVRDNRGTYGISPPEYRHRRSYGLRDICRFDEDDEDTPPIAPESPPTTPA